MPITAGSIRVVRRIQTGEYHSFKEVSNELHYTAEAGEDIKVLGAQAAHAALVHVAEVMATVVTLNSTPEITVGAPESVKSDQVEQAEEQKKRHRRTKAEMEAARAAEVAMVEQQVGEPSADPTPEPAQNPVASTPQFDAAPVQTDEDWATGPLAEITDKELNNACNETMNRIKNKVAIQGVIQRYTDGAVSTIPQAERAKFLTELKVL